MWNSLRHWFHHLFNPHCPQCAIEYRCESCETLRHQIDVMNEQNRQLTLALVEMSKPTIVNEAAGPSPTDIKLPRRPHWRVKQAELEQASRDRAMALRNAAKPDKEDEVTVSSLEAELESVEKARTNAKVN